MTIPPQPPGHAPAPRGPEPSPRYGYQPIDAAPARRTLALIGAGHLVVLLGVLVLAVLLLTDANTPDPDFRRLPGLLVSQGLALALLGIALICLIVAQVLALRRARDLRRSIGPHHADIDVIAHSLRRAGYPVLYAQSASSLALPSLFINPPPPALIALVQLAAGASLLLNSAHAGWAFRVLTSAHNGGSHRLLPPGIAAGLYRQQPAGIFALAAMVVSGMILTTLTVTGTHADPLRAVLATAAAIGVTLLPIPLIRAGTQLRAAVDRDWIRFPPLHQAGRRVATAALAAVGVQALATVAVLGTPTPGLPSIFALLLLLLVQGAIALQYASVGSIYLGDLAALARRAR